MSDSSLLDSLPLELIRQIDAIAEEVEACWFRGESPVLEDYLTRIEPRGYQALFAELLHLELTARRQRGEVPQQIEFAHRFPSCAADLTRIFAESESAAPHAPRSAAATCEDRLPTIPGFRILRSIGRGAMGIVYLAEHQKLKRLVAIKMVAVTADPVTARSRMRAEADLIARLQHPHVVQIFDVGENDGATFLVLEYVDGESLRERLQREQIETTEAVKLIEILARAMHYTHSHSVIHRDLKPGNVLLEPHVRDAAANDSFMVDNFRIKITDFGLAKVLDDQHHQTQVGLIVGTPNYMSPEQAAGRNDEVGASTDIYALGAMLFELLSRRPPFEADSTLELLRRIATVDPTFPPAMRDQIPRDLQAICLKCLEKKPEQRYASAAELADDLRRYLENFPVRARIPSHLELFRKFTRRNRLLVAGLITIAMTLVLGFISTLVFAQREAHQRRTAESLAREASRNERQARQESYRARIALAVADVESHDVVDAARQLEQAATEFRGWEWFHLKSRLDESTMRKAVEPTDGLSMYLVPEGPRVTVVGQAGISVLNERFEKLYELSPGRFSAIQYLGETSSGPWVLTGDNQLLLLNHQAQLQSRFAIPADLADNRLTAFLVDRQGTKMAVGGAHSNDPDLQRRFLVIDMETGARLGPFLEHTGRITGLTFNPDATRIVSTSEDGTARLWDFTSVPATSVPLLGHQLFVRHPKFRPDGARFLTCSADGTVRQWDSLTGQAVEPPYEGHTGGVYSASYSPDGQWIVSTGEDRTIRVWKAEGRTRRSIFHGHTNLVTEVAFTTDGQQIVSVARDHTIRLWSLDAKSNPEVLRGHHSSVYPVEFSPDGTWLASGSWDHSVKLWDVTSGAPRGELLHAGIVRTLAISADGTWLVSGCDSERELTLWDTKSLQIRRKIPGPPGVLYAVAVHPRGIEVAAIDNGGALVISDVAKSQIIATDQLAQPGLRGALAYSPDGKFLAVACAEGNVGMWNTTTHQLQSQWPGHAGSVYSLAFDRTGRRLVSGGSDGTVRVWDTVTGKCQSTMRGPAGEIFSAVFNTTGDRVISGGRDQMVWIWDTATGQEIARLKSHTNFIYSVAFHPQGSLLASGSGDGSVNLWHAKSIDNR